MIQITDFKPGQIVFVSCWRGQFCYTGGKHFCKKEVIETVDYDRDCVTLAELPGMRPLFISLAEGCLIEEPDRSAYFPDLFTTKAYLTEEDCRKGADRPKLIKKIRTRFHGEKAFELSHDQLKAIDEAITTIIEGEAAKED
jgi:hypothetical protein